MISTDNIRVKQKYYSQNAEDVFVLDYFKGFKGTLLEVGANDGRTLSNSLLLIENGWKGHLIEPGRKVFGSLYALHEFNPSVKMYNYGIGNKFETVTLYESGAHIINGSDLGLVSTIDYAETERWRKSGVQFDEITIQINTFDGFYKFCNSDTFDFISIDAEGLDWQILQQIDLNSVGCKCLCIEFNGDNELQVRFSIYCASYGLKLAHINNENLIYIR